jgi:hypothetical protein
MSIEQLDHLGEVGERAGEAVHLVDHDRIDPVAPDVPEKPLQARPLHGGAREAAIVVGRLDEPPALMALTPDIGLAGLALGLEGVEILLQPLLGGLAGVDGATADPRARHRATP